MAAVDRGVASRTGHHMQAMASVAANVRPLGDCGVAATPLAQIALVEKPDPCEVRAEHFDHCSVMSFSFHRDRSVRATDPSRNSSVQAAPPCACVGDVSNEGTVVLFSLELKIVYGDFDRDESPSLVRCRDSKVKEPRRLSSSQCFGQTAAGKSGSISCTVIDSSSSRE